MMGLISNAYPIKVGHISNGAIVFTLALGLSLAATVEGRAQSSCSATNDNETKRCNVSCDEGERAICRDGVGDYDPECFCEDASMGKVPPVQLEQLGINRFNNTVDEEILTDKIIEQDVRAEINKKLNDFGDIYIRDECWIEEVTDRCYPARRYPCLLDNSINKGVDPLWCYDPGGCTYKNVRRCRPVNGKLTIAGPIDVVEGPIAGISLPDKDGIPASYLSLFSKYYNCTGTNQTQEFSHTEEELVGYSHQTRKSVKTERGSSVSIGVKFKLSDYFGSDVKGTFSFKKSVDVSSTENIDLRTRKQFSMRLPVNILAFTEVRVYHDFVKRSIPVEFTGSLVVDGNLIANKGGYSRLSDVYPKAEDRRFSFAGVIDGAFVNDNSTEAIQTKLDPSACQRGFLVTSEISSR